MARAPFDFHVGEVVAGHRVQKVIGRGGSATVYQAVPLAGGESVALKLMHEHDPSGVGRKRFAREAALLKKLQHPHVVRMFDYGYTEADLPFIVFELLVGQSLKGAIRAVGEFATERVARITLQLLDALEVAHQMGIIHRDIKPQNVFMRAGNLDDHALLLDLGLAKAIEGDGVETKTITGTGYRLGTPRYMSPEMARGDVSGAPGDLYAVALLMAEMIAGRPVVEATAQIDILMAHASTEALRLPDACSASPFYAIIQRALAKDLKVRYRTALQMRADVQATSDLHQRAVKMAERLEGMSPDMAPTLALDDDMADALSAAVRQAANAPPPELGQTIQLDDAAFATMRMESMSADRPATASSAPAPMVFVAPPPRPADTSSRGGFVWVIVLFVALMVIFAVGGYLLAG